MSIVFLTDFPKWVNIQFTKFSLEKPVDIGSTTKANASLYGYDLRIKDAMGEEFQLSHFKGKYVFLNLWASWCVPCLAEFSSIESLASQLPEMEFIVLNIEDQASFENYVESSSHELPFYVLKSPMPRELSAEAIPATFILNDQGEIIYEQVGAADWSDSKTVAEIKKLLN